MTEEIDNILEYIRKAGLNTISTKSPAWKFTKCKTNKIYNSIQLTSEKKLDISIEHKNGQKMTVGQLVRHRTVPQLGLGLVVAESEKHKDHWIVQWCDRQYHDVGQLGIGRDYLVIV